MGAGIKVCPIVYIASKGVVPAVSPKSYENGPRVSEGQELGSMGIILIFAPLILSVTNGNESPAKLEPPPAQPMTISTFFSPASFELFFGFEADDCLMEHNVV